MECFDERFLTVGRLVVGDGDSEVPDSELVLHGHLEAQVSISLLELEGAKDHAVVAVL